MLGTLSQINFVPSGETVDFTWLFLKMVLVFVVLVLPVCIVAIKAISLIRRRKKCPNCGEMIATKSTECSECGLAQNAPNGTYNKFPALRVIAVSNKIVAWTILAFGMSIAILASVWTCSAYAKAGVMTMIIVGVGTAITVIVIALAYFLLWYALSEIICLIVDLEENTRLTSQYLRQLSMQLPETKK